MRREKLRTWLSLLVVCLAFATTQAAQGAKLVQPVILVAKDWTADFNSWEIERFFRYTIVPETQRFYAYNVGKNFKTTSVQVVKADKNASWFWCKTVVSGCAKNNFEHNVVQYLNSKGVNVDDNGDRVHWILAMGGSAYAGGRYFSGSGGGRSIIGDAAVTVAKYGNCNRVRAVFSGDDVVSKCAGWSNKTGHGKGTFIHELGHAFDLPHPPTSQYGDTVMGAHWDYPDTGLITSDVNTLLGSPFFGALHCSGKCGGYSSTGGCYCDDSCARFGDCCSDFAPACAAQKGVVPNGRYSLEVQAYNGGYLDVQWGATGNGTNVWLWSWNGSGAQLWDLTHNASDDTYRIRGVQSGKCLASNYPTPSNGVSNAFIWSCDGSASQRWRIESIGGGHYYVRPKSQAYSSCLDTCCSIGQSSNSYYYPCHFQQNQKWRLQKR